jgi:predicted cation transporter
MGIMAAVASGVFSKQMVLHILENHLIYIITLVVFISSIIFKLFKDRINSLVNSVLRHVPIRIFIFLVIILLGLMSSVITAIIASLILVEILLPINIERKNKIKILIIACFSIGIGAALTPVGEPLSTIVVSKLGESFDFIFSTIGVHVILGVLFLGFLGSIYAKYDKSIVDNETGETARILAVDKSLNDETYGAILYRALKIFIFIIALDLLGSGFKPIIDSYVIGLDNNYLYWGNMSSAILDNATLAAAEISPKLDIIQIRNILLGLLASGGMLIPGNIPNIITADKFKIKSSEWARFGIPLGLVMLVGYYVVLF